MTKMKHINDRNKEMTCSAPFAISKKQNFTWSSRIFHIFLVICPSKGFDQQNVLLQKIKHCQYGLKLLSLKVLYSCWKLSSLFRHLKKSRSKNKKLYRINHKMYVTVLLTKGQIRKPTRWVKIEQNRIIKKSMFQNHVLRTGYFFLFLKYLSRLFVLNLKMKFWS